MWWPQAVPKRFIRRLHGPPGHRALFAGTPYGQRKTLLADPALAGIVALLKSPEEQSIYPLVFDGLHTATFQFVSQGRRGVHSALALYLDTLRRVRQACFGLFLDGLAAGCAVLNLPHLVKTYAGRVVEGMAAGRPVISWEIPDRPANRALFEDGREIFLFDPTQPRQIAEHIRRVIVERGLADRVVENARRKVEAFHTIEHRVQQILDWSTTGRAPTFA
jgi:glycosyltransferase involved in cell wall biosynthesis